MNVNILTTVFIASALLTACSASNSDTEAATQAEESFDPELLALLPKNVPGHELGWLSGHWAKDATPCMGADAAYIIFSASDDGLFAIASPEPNKADSGAKVSGIAEVNPGERGFTYVTPPEWDDTYLRIKASGERNLDVEFVEFNPVGPVWDVTEEFTLNKCN